MKETNDLHGPVAGDTVEEHVTRSSSSLSDVVCEDAGRVADLGFPWVGSAAMASNASEIRSSYSASFTGPKRSAVCAFTSSMSSHARREIRSLDISTD